MRRSALATGPVLAPVKNALHIAHLVGAALKLIVRYDINKYTVKSKAANDSDSMTPSLLILAMTHKPPGPTGAAINENGTTRTPRAATSQKKNKEDLYWPAIIKDAVDSEKEE